jgi:sigma-B regulation protein RsbQ
MQQIITKKNNIRFLGKGTKTLLFVHGYGCDQSMWRNLVPKFEDKFKIILIDLVGSGESDSSFYDFKLYNTLDSYASDIIDICKEFNLSDIVLIGHSVSATICALACIQEPQLFSKLIMVCPSPRYINDEGYNGGFNRGDIDDLLESLDTNYNTWSHSVAPLIMSNLDRPELSDEWKSSFCKNRPIYFKAFCQGYFSRR